MAAASLSEHPFAAAFSTTSAIIPDPASSSFLPSPPSQMNRPLPLPLPLPLRQIQTFTSRPSLCLKVSATVGYPTSISWWKKGERFTNMREIASGDQLCEALAEAALQEKLVVVDFYSIGCRACKALYPKVCQLAAENPNVEILTVNFYDNIALCRSLNINILPFFHFYRGTDGRVDAFSCSLSKIDKLRAAVAKYQEGDHHLLIKKMATPYSQLELELRALPTLAGAVA